MKTLLERRQHERSGIRAGVDRTHTLRGSPRTAATASSLLSTESRSFFLLKRSPLSVKEKRKEKNRGKGYSEMRVFLPPPRSQTQVWTRRASWAPRARGWRGSLAGGPPWPPRLPLSLPVSVPPRASRGRSLCLGLLSLSCCSQWCFSFSSGKQVSIYFYFLLPRIRC